MNITIAVADSCRYEVTNKEFTYKEFREYILGFKDVHINFIKEDNQPFQTALEKCIKNKKIGIPGYVGGIFNGDKVKRDEENLSYRNLIVLDIDDYSKGLSNLVQLLHNELGRYKYLAHSTINHTPDKPRIRIILFPNRNIDKKEFKTVVNNFSATLNFKIDESSTKPNQFMLVAVTPKFSNLPKDEESKRIYSPWQLENEKGELINVEEYTHDKILTENDEHLEEMDIINLSSSNAKEQKEEENLEALSKEFVTYHKNLPLEIPREKIDETLSNYNCNETDYHSWFTVCQALHHQFKGGEEGLEVFTNWSLTDNRYQKKDIRKECREKYHSLKRKTDNPITFASVISAVNEKMGTITNFHEIADSNKSTKLDHELLELLNEIKSDANQYNEETGEQKPVSLDSFKYKKRIKEIRTRLLRENIGLDKKRLNDFTILNNIYSDIREYNNLLSLDENEDKPYTRKQFLEDVAKNINGLKTGFIELDKHVIIQPSSLAFIAGRPSHGKTTMMLNILRNMLEDEDNKDKAFLFYSYEETRSDIFIKMVLSVVNDSGLDEELKKLGVEGVNLRQRALNQFKSHTQNDIPLHRILATAYNKVNSWIEEGRLEILTPINSTESLSAAIIKRCMSFQREEQQAQHTEVKKEVAAVFIDYVQKLSTEEKRDNRQQEIQRICQTLLSTALDKRVATSIILGAQANREVKSLDTLTLDNMRESGDIEQDANLVLGIWDEQAGELDSLQREQQEIQKKIEEKEDYNEKLSEKLATVNKKINERNSRNSQYKPLKIKVLKNRNGAKDVTIDLYFYPNVYYIHDERRVEQSTLDKALDKTNIQLENEGLSSKKNNPTPMRDYSISFFDNVTSKVPKERKLTFDEILKYFNEVGTKPFSKKENLGAMICGSFSKPQRASEYLVSRSIITYDIDNFKGNFDELLALIKKSSIADKTFIYYTTTSSTILKPRLRLMLFISKDIEAKHYNKIVHNIAYEWFPEELRNSVDKSSYSPMQLMLLPNKCNNDFRIGENIGHIFDANEFLDGYYNEDINYTL